MTETPDKTILDADLEEEGWQQASALLHQCSTPDGFLASPSEFANYRRVWARDSVIMGLAALLTDDPHLVTSFRSSLDTLIAHQGPHGEIPSNVDALSERVSFGGTTGRVDADLWYIIGATEYWMYTQDEDFLRQHLPCIEKVRFLLGAWEYNNRGLLFVPPTGDWADEYIQSGYVLYDQLLYLQAQRSLAVLHEHLHGSHDHILQEHITRLKHLIRANYWFYDKQTMPDDAYHEVLYRKGLQANQICVGQYWLPFFSPTSYGYRFDTFANVMASVFNIADSNQCEQVDEHIDSIVNPDLILLPAFDPVIEPIHQDWENLQMTFSYSFRNNPYEYHNGGLWSMLTGFYVASLAQRGCHERAIRFYHAILQANEKGLDGQEWGFAEYLHGKKLTPAGTQQQGWSAAALIIARQVLKGQVLFRVNEND